MDAVAGGIEGGGDGVGAGVSVGGVDFVEDVLNGGGAGGVDGEAGAAIRN